MSSDLRATPKTLLVGFSDGSRRWRRAARRFERQGKKIGWFSDVLVFDCVSLKGLVPEAFPDNNDLFTKDTPGFGYWTWKAHLLKHFVEKQGAEYDRVLYLDIGCNINASVQAQARFKEYEQLTDDRGILLFHMPHIPEQNWTKPEVLDFFGLNSRQRLSGQIQGGTIMMKCGSLSGSLCDEWITAMERKDYCLVRDPVTSEDLGGLLIAHRHDQSVLSCMSKSLGIVTVPDETYFADAWDTSGAGFPIWAVRNRSGVTFTTNHLWFTFKKLVEKIYLAVTPGN